MSARRLPNTALLLPVLTAMLLGGCATREFVQQQVGQVGQRIDGLEGLLKAANLRIETHGSRLLESEGRLVVAEQRATWLSQRNDETQAGLEGAKQRLQVIAGEVSTAQKQIEAGSVEAARAHQRLDEVDQRLNVATRRLQGTVAGLAMTEGRIGALESNLRAVATVSPAAPETAAMPLAMAVPAAAASAAPVAPEAVAAANPTLPPAAAAHPPASPAAPASQPPIAPSIAPPPILTPPNGAAPLLAEANSRLDQIAALLHSANQKIAANAAALASTSTRVDGLEQGLDATDRRTRESENGIKLTQQKLGDVQARLDNASSLIAGNSESLAQAGQRIDALGNGLAKLDQRLDSSEQSLAESRQRLAQAEDGLKQQNERLSRNEAEGSTISSLAQEALARARTAHRLAEGKLVFVTTLTEDVATFGFEQTKLNAAAKQTLADFANRLKTENQNVFIEIQGHTDSAGPAAANMLLSRQRAEQVRDYLHLEGGIALHRLAVAAYGETRPVADNKTKQGRSQNRRVVIVVLK